MTEKAIDWQKLERKAAEVINASRECRARTNNHGMGRDDLFKVVFREPVCEHFQNFQACYDHLQSMFNNGRWSCEKGGCGWQEMSTIQSIELTDPD